MRFILFIRAFLFALALLAISSASSAQVGIAVSIRIAPPELPIYEQPICPDEGYIWTPGYWAYGDDDYYWVPGTWVMAPEVGYLWTPGYWGGDGDGYIFHEGYWGTEVGFYGGINYGYGYFGRGYEGGRWDNGHFAYNQSVSRVDGSRNRNVYNARVDDNNHGNRVSFNGGNGGVQVRATSQEESAGRERHIAPVAAQTQHVQSARANPELRASANRGNPPIAATAKPGAFKDTGSIAASEGGTVHTPPDASSHNNIRQASETPRPAAETNQPATETARPAVDSNRPNPRVHAKDLTPAEHVANPNTGNARQDQKFQDQQQKLQAQQSNERQKLQTKQEQDHQRLPQKPENEPKQQLLEQRHQQQTQQLAQRHDHQQQQLQQRQQPPPNQAAPKPAEKEKPAA
jgi:WXXGXW repeat (2 copies)